MQRDQPAVINQQGIARQAHADKSILNGLPCGYSDAMPLQ